MACPGSANRQPSRRPPAMSGCHVAGVAGLHRFAWRSGCRGHPYQLEHHPCGSWSVQTLAHASALPRKLTRISLLGYDGVDLPTRRSHLLHPAWLDPAAHCYDCVADLPTQVWGKARFGSLHHLVSVAPVRGVRLTRGGRHLDRRTQIAHSPAARTGDRVWAESHLAGGGSRASLCLCPRGL